uniref:SAM domain-containing protein n=1 Tax=Panagrellus redivivus TaxID=6233 RepID=A0A7E4W2J8_PANRE
MHTGIIDRSPRANPQEQNFLRPHFSRAVDIYISSRATTMSSTKERSVRFSTHGPVEHESLDFGVDERNIDFDRIMAMEPPPFISDEEFIELDACTAASLGWEFIEHLSPSKLTPTEMNTSSWTPLMYSAYLGHVKVCEYLCKNGASLEAVNEAGQTALMLAASCGSKEMVALLVEKGASVNLQDKIGQSALHYATWYNQSSITEVLLKSGGDPNLPDSSGMTPTLNACKVGNDATVSLLMKYKGDPSRKNSSGEDGEMLAAEQPNVLKVLQSRLTISDLLRQLGLEKYIPIFERDEITLNLFLKLTEEDLAAMGITLFGPKKKIMNVIRHYEKYGVIATDQEIAPQNTAQLKTSEQSYYQQNTNNGANTEEPQDTGMATNTARSTVTLTKTDIRDQWILHSDTRAFLHSLLEKKTFDAVAAIECKKLIYRIDAAMKKLAASHKN